MNNCKRVLIMKNIYILYTKFNLLVINELQRKALKKQIYTLIHSNMIDSCFS